MDSVSNEHRPNHTLIQAERDILTVLYFAHFKNRTNSTKQITDQIKLSSRSPSGYKVDQIAIIHPVPGSAGWTHT